METGIVDIDGRTINVGDVCIPVRGFYSQKRFKGYTATLVWIPPMLTWKWSDGYVNPVPVQNPGNFRVVDPK